MKNFLVIFSFLCIYTVCFSQVRHTTPSVCPPKEFPFAFNLSGLQFKPEVVQVQVTQSEQATSENSVQTGYFDELISFAKKFMGVPYRYAGYSPYGFDCSGFTSYVYARFGKTLSRSAIVQALEGKTIPIAEARKGDLIFFKGRNWRSSAVGHVGLVISNPGEKLTFIHASCNLGISIETIYSPYYQPRFIKICRIVE
jgi:cell wall-associated NlpC family hydrolase